MFDRQACNGWREVRLMKHGRSQIPVSPLIEPTEGGLCCGEVPQSGSEEEAAFPQVKRELVSWGNNVYVLNFKHFLPVRKSRCKGMFLYLKDLKKFQLFLLLLSVFLRPGVMVEWQSLALHHLNTQRTFELNLRTGCFRRRCSAFF